ncbi:MAG: FG-GAP-like repeat-containing protein, partial [Planctomycetota bacterium]
MLRYLCLFMTLVISQSLWGQAPPSTGNGFFEDSCQALGSGWSRMVSLGDIDGDGDLDALVANDGGQQNKVWINQGGDQTGSPGQFLYSGQSLGESGQCISLGDLDGDGDLDAIVARYSSPNKVWINQGGNQSGTPGQFLDSGQALGGSNSWDIALGDVDGDGDLD